MFLSPALNLSGRVAVFGPHDRLNAREPAAVSKDFAKTIFKRNLGNWVNRSTGIQLTRLGAQLLQLEAWRMQMLRESKVDEDLPAKYKRSEFRDESAQMGPGVTVRAVQGSRYHMNMVKAWR